MRHALAAVALALALAAVPPAAAGASPSLGGTISPAPIHVDDGERAVNVTNRSTVAVAVALSVAGDGYRLAVSELRLEPGARATVTLAAVGPGSAVISAVLVADSPPASGQQAVALRLETTARHRTPLEAIGREVAMNPLILFAIVVTLLAILVIALAVALRRGSA